MPLNLISFLLATMTVAVVTTLMVRRMRHSSDAVEDFFIGGRSLAWPIVAGSLLLTNISTEQLVGLNGAVYKDGNLVGIAWEVLAAFAMIATALLFLPRYLRGGFTTTPGFLEDRYDATTKRLVSALFLFGYVSVLLPVVLYTGSLALKTMFGLDDIPLWMMVIGIGALGSAYAIVGGLRAVAVSDTINGIGLLVGGLAVPFLALAALGEGSVVEGAATLLREKPGSLAPLATTNRAGDAASVPWPTLLTGIMFIQVFYWSTNHVIVQRAMAARSLADGQRGVLFASALKLAGPLMLCLPGIIALHMVTELGIEKDDQVYPAIVRHVLPDWSLGLFAAAMVGAILSSFNSALNSASTLFCVDFYQPFLGRRRPEGERARQTVRVGRIFGLTLAVVSMVVAPLLARNESIFAYLQKVNGLYSVPIIAIFLVGITSERAPAWGAKLAMLVGIAFYALFTFKSPWPDLHWLHGYFISTMASILVLLVAARISPRTEDEIAAASRPTAPPVDMTPWRFARPASLAIVVAATLIYVSLQLASKG